MNHLFMFLVTFCALFSELFDNNTDTASSCSVCNVYISVCIVCTFVILSLLVFSESLYFKNVSLKKYTTGFKILFNLLTFVFTFLYFPTLCLSVLYSGYFSKL